MTRVYCAGAGPRRVRHGVRGRARAGREERGHQARGQGQGLGVGRGELDTGVSFLLGDLLCDVLFSCDDVKGGWCFG